MPSRQRFHTTISVLGDGRLDLATAAVASARAALAGLANYALRRCSGALPMIDRDPVRRDLVTGLTAIYATSVLGRQLRDMRATGSPQWSGLWSSVAKPLLSDTAYQVLVTCRRRTGAQGALRSNYLPDWIANTDGIVTAEGENQILQVAAGKTVHDLLALHLPGTPAKLPSYIELLTEREHTIADALHRGNVAAAGPVWGADCAAIEFATATGERLAATALAIAADTTAEHVIRSAAAAYALDRIYDHGSWYASHGTMDQDRAEEVRNNLTYHRSVLAEHLSNLVAAFDIPVLPGAALFAPDYTAPYRILTDWDDVTSPHNRTGPTDRPTTDQ